MVFVGGSVAVSAVLDDAPLWAAQAVRYAIACGLLHVMARVTRRRVVLPRGTEWLWLVGVAASGLVLFNIALVEGSRHAEPAVLGVAVAAVPLVLAVAGPLTAGRRPGAAVVGAAGVVTAGAVLVEGGGRSDLTGLAWAALVLGPRRPSPCSRSRCCAATARGGCPSTAPGWPSSCSARCPSRRSRRTPCSP